MEKWPLGLKSGNLKFLVSLCMLAGRGISFPSTLRLPQHPHGGPLHSDLCHLWSTQPLASPLTYSTSLLRWVLGSISSLPSYLSEFGLFNICHCAFYPQSIDTSRPSQVPKNFLSWSLHGSAPTGSSVCEVLCSDPHVCYCLVCLCIKLELSRRSSYLEGRAAFPTTLSVCLRSSTRRSAFVPRVSCGNLCFYIIPVYIKPLPSSILFAEESGELIICVWPVLLTQSFPETLNTWTVLWCSSVTTLVHRGSLCTSLVTLIKAGPWEPPTHPHL